MPIGKIHTLDRDRGGIQEGREFSNPHVRFRMIRGRVVPIFNQKRIGEDVNQLGKTTARTGAAIIGASLAARAVSRTKIFGLAAKVLSKIPKSAGSALPVKSNMGGVQRTLQAATKLTGRSIGFILRNRFKIGGALFVGGGLGYAGGKELEARSPFGADLTIGE